MLDKKKKYTYEELKKIFETAEVETVMNPLGENKDNKEITGEAKFMTMMIAMPTIHTLKEKLFGKEEK